MTRPRRLLWSALPAILAATILLGLLIASQQISRSELIEAYNREVVDAFRREDFETADLYLRKMAYLDDSNPRVLYALALAAERRGKLARARDLMRRVAPDDNVGLAAAHFWLARDLVNAAGEITLPQLERLEHHLQRANDGQPNNLEAALMLARLHCARGQLQEAIPLFERVASRWPHHFLDVARVQAALGETNKARLAAETASARLRHLTESEPDNFEYRLAWAESQRFLEQFPEAIRILREGGKPAEPRMRTAVTLVYVSWYDQVSRFDKDNLGRRLELLQQALVWGPDHPAALNRLASLTAIEGSGAAAEDLAVALAKGTAPATVHFILGTAAANNGQDEQAIRHLELAFEEMPQLPVVANNLAWALAHADPPDLARAEQLIEAAIKIAPARQQHEIRETRGVIKAKLGKHKDAIVDLEHALRSFPDRPRLHEWLAALYDKIGDQQMAHEHRKLAEEKTAVP